jgi:hypothetical protein
MDFYGKIFPKNSVRLICSVVGFLRLLFKLILRQKIKAGNATKWNG